MKETKAYNIVADLHCHTIASTHAYSTITELAQAARRRGLVAVGCTDHGVAMWDAPKMSYFGNLNNLPKKIEGQGFTGVEAMSRVLTGVWYPGRPAFTYGVVIA